MAGAALTFTDKPNVKMVSHAPGDGNWNAVTIPTSVPIGAAAVTATIKSMASTGAADGSLFLVAIDPTTVPTTNAEGFPVSGSGQAIAVNVKRSIYIKLTVTTTDLIQIMFAW